MVAYNCLIKGKIGFFVGANIYLFMYNNDNSQRKINDDESR